MLEIPARAVETAATKHPKLAEVLAHHARTRLLANLTRTSELFRALSEAAEELRAREETARRIAKGFEVKSDVAIVHVPEGEHGYDKTLLLMIGQERARISVVCDTSNVTVAARFDSGVDLLALLGLEGGMPTVVSVARSELPNVLRKLGVPEG